jgi:hypothetical protein
MTTTADPAFQYDFSAQGSFAAFAAQNGAPPEAERIITLSTCDGVNNERRMLLQGVLRQTRQVTPVMGENGWVMQIV